MHEYVSFNNRIYLPQQINLSAISSASLYGKGVFTTLAVYNGKPFLWEKHWKRIAENAKRLSIDLSDFSDDLVKQSLSKLIKKNKTSKARIRLTFFDESSGEIWKIKNNRNTSLLITSADLREISESFSLIISKYPVNSCSPLVNVKSCNYLENIVSLQEATEKGVDEAVRINEKGKIVSACLANIFWMKEQKIFTPYLKTGALQGTTRELILENFDILETESDLKEIETADSVFLTSSGIGIVEVKNVDEVFYKSSETFRAITNFFEKFRNIE